ncbi:hypothetical protein WMY93_022293 [Mugilogobius chulae]|uniref:Uncharacterized protein n=1 Tax=Mugilogobius chulae TaxID=88201 RepID=A0AAW0NJ01_9GOBI
MKILSGSLPAKENEEHVVMVEPQIITEKDLPQDHFIWSLICCIYFNFCCLGLAALHKSVKARDSKMVGNLAEAHRHGSRARTLNICSTVFFILFAVAAIIVYCFLFLNLGYREETFCTPTWDSLRLRWTSCDDGTACDGTACDGTACDGPTDKCESGGDAQRPHYLVSCQLHLRESLLPGLAALIHSVKARDRKVAGDIEAARTYGSKARTFNIISTVLLCICILLYIVVYAVVLSRARYHG